MISPADAKKLFSTPRATIAALAVVFLLSLLLIRAGYSYHVATMSEIEARVGDYEAAISMVGMEEELKKRKESGEKRLMELEKGLLKADKPSTGAAMLQEAFKALTVKKGITVASEKALPHSEQGIYVRVPVEFQLRAGLPQLKDLLYEMSGSAYIMGVKKIRIKKAGQGGPGALDVTLTVEGAYKKQAGT